MKKMIMVLAALLLLGGCAVQPQSEAPAPSDTQPVETSGTTLYRKISPEKAHEMMAEDGITIVDVRTEEEFAAGHIANAVLVPNETISDTAPEALPDKDAVLLVYCRSGRRSKEASEKLLELGYTNIYDFGGIIDWPYEVVTE